MNWILFAYFGPESMLPVTSVLAAFVGFFMMFGAGAVRFARRWIVSRTVPTRVVNPPHFRVEQTARSYAEKPSS